MACANPQGVVAPGGGARACNASDPAGYTSTPVQKSLDKSWSAFTPRLAADYSFNPTSMGYISYSRGFKSGAFDGRSNTAAAILPLAPINPETIDTIEIGAKTDLAKGKARLNAAVFFNKWKDLQGTGTDPNGNFYRTTLGDVHTRGAEFEARVVPGSGLEFFGQLSLLSTGYDTVTFNQTALCGNLNTGTRELELKMAPPYSYQVGALYSRPGAGGRFSAGGPAGPLRAPGDGEANVGVVEAATRIDPRRVVDLHRRQADQIVSGKREGAREDRRVGRRQRLERPRVRGEREVAAGEMPARDAVFRRELRGNDERRVEAELVRRCHARRVVPEAHPDPRPGDATLRRPSLQPREERIRHGLVGADVAHEGEHRRPQAHHLRRG